MELNSICYSYLIMRINSWKLIDVKKFKNLNIIQLWVYTTSHVTFKCSIFASSKRSILMLPFFNDKILFPVLHTISQLCAI